MRFPTWRASTDAEQHGRREPHEKGGRQGPGEQHEPRWTEVDAGFHVANRDGAFVGSVSAVRGGFVAMDARGTPVGRFPDLDAAQASLRSVMTGQSDRQRYRRDVMRLRRLRPAAAGVLTPSA